MKNKFYMLTNNLLRYTQKIPSLDLNVLVVKNIKIIIKITNFAFIVINAMMNKISIVLIAENVITK